MPAGFRRLVSLRLARSVVFTVVALSLASTVTQAAPPSAPGRAMDECLAELGRIGLYGPEASLRVAIDLRDAASVTITLDTLLQQISVPDACRSVGAGFVAEAANPGHFGTLEIQGPQDGLRELSSGPGGGSAVWTPRYDRKSIGQDEITFRVFLTSTDVSRLPIGEIAVLLHYTPATR